MQLFSKEMSSCFVVKVCVVGDSGVGKSSLVVRFTKDHFYSNLLPTLGAGFLTRCVKGEHGGLYKLQIWDTAGQERYKSIAPLYYRGASIILIVYDVTNRESLVNGAMRWVKELRLNGPPNALFALVGNKIDVAEGLREIEEKEARQFADRIGAVYCETSAKSGYNVNDLFLSLCTSLEKERSLVPCQDNDEIESDDDDKEKGKSKKGWFSLFQNHSSFHNEELLSQRTLKLRLYGRNLDDPSCCLS